MKKSIVIIVGSLFAFFCIAMGADNSKSEALAAQLANLNQPKGVDSEAKADKLTESPVNAPKEEAKTYGKTPAGVPVTYITTTQKFKASAAFDQQVLLNPGTDVIYPGSVLLGHTISSGTYQEVTKGIKKPVTISYDLTNIKKISSKTNKLKDGKVSGTIIPTASNFRELHNKIMGQELGSASTTYSFEETSVSNESDFSIKFNFGVGFKTGIVESQVKTGFDFGKGSKKNKYMVKFMETFYTVDVSQGNDTFLYESFNIKDFKGYRPVYVASVAYGRLAYLTIETDESWENIKSNLNIVVDAGLYGKYEGEVGTAINSLNKSSKINITVIGGGAVATSLDSFMKMLKNNGFSKKNPGKIIAYKLRFVDDNSVANTVYNDEYTLTKTVEQLGRGIDTTFTLYKIKTNSKDKGGKALEIYGNLEINDGTTPKSFWSFPRKYFKKYKDRGETTENTAIKYTVPNDNATFNITLTLADANSGGAKKDTIYTDAAGNLAGNSPKQIMLNNFKDGQEIVIRAYSTEVKKKQRVKKNNEWIEFYIRVNKTPLY